MNKAIEYAVGVAAFFIAVAISSWIFKNFLGLIGFGLFVWGIVELFKKKYVKTRKVQFGLIATGFAMILFWSFFMAPQPSGTTDNLSDTTTLQQKQEINDETTIPPTNYVEQENNTLKEQQKEDRNVTGNHQASTTSVTFVQALVTNIVDGDTIDVTFDGKTERVRLLLVDTPETKDPNEPVQPFGPEATEFAEKTLSGKEVKLEFDGPERDKYDRLLVYLWIGENIFNKMLLEEGLARIAYVYDPPYTHYDEFVEAEQKAKSEKKGIWSIPGYVTEEGFIDEVAATTEEQEQNPEPEPQPIQQGNVYYKNCSEAREAGAAPIMKGEPGYRPALDRDNDGIACE